MATRYQQIEDARRREEERQQEMGQRFLKQMADMFTATRQDLSAQFMPRAETQARMDHIDEVVERTVTAVEKLTSNITNFQENVPRLYAEKAETKQDLAELRTEIEKLKTARESDMQRGYGQRFEDMQGRWQADAGIERGWRASAQARSNQVQGWVYSAGTAIFVTALYAIIYLAIR